MVCGTACAIIGNFASYEMMDKVNDKLPKADQFDPLGWHPTKTLRLHREYRRLYPEGRLPRKLHVLTALLFSCWLISVWSFGFFEKRASVEHLSSGNRDGDRGHLRPHATDRISSRT